MVFLLGATAFIGITPRAKATGWSYANITTNKSLYNFGEYVYIYVDLYGNRTNHTGYIDVCVNDSYGANIFSWNDQYVDNGTWYNSFYLNNSFRTGTWTIEVWETNGVFNWLGWDSFEVENGTSEGGWDTAYIYLDKYSYAPGEWVDIYIYGDDSDGDPSNNYIDVHIMDRWGSSVVYFGGEYVGSSNWSESIYISENASNGTNGMWTIEVYESYFGYTLLDREYFEVNGSQNVQYVDLNTYYLEEYSYYFNPGDMVEIRGTAYYDWGYSPASNVDIILYIYDPNYDVIDSLSVKTDDHGTFSVDYPLQSTAIQGRWRIYVKDPEDEYYNETIGSDYFRVEEKYAYATVSASPYYVSPGGEINMDVKVRYNTHDDPIPDKKILIKILDVYNEWVSALEVTTDTNGEASASYTVPHYVYKGYFQIGIYDPDRDKNDPHYQINDDYWGNRSSSGAFGVIGIYTSNYLYDPGDTVYFDDYYYYYNHSSSHRVFEWSPTGTNFEYTSVDVKCAGNTVWSEANTTKGGYYDGTTSFQLGPNAPFGRYDITMTDIDTPSEKLTGFFYVVDASISDMQGKSKYQYVQEEDIKIHIKAGQGMDLKAVITDEDENEITTLSGTAGADGILDIIYKLPGDMSDGKFTVYIKETTGERIIRMNFNVEKFTLIAYTDVEAYLPGESGTIYYTLTNNYDNGEVEDAVIDYTFTYWLGAEEKHITGSIERAGSSGSIVIDIPQETNTTRSCFMELWANDTGGRSQTWFHTFHLGNIDARLGTDASEYITGDFVVVNIFTEVLSSGEYWYGYTYPDDDHVIFDGTPVYLGYSNYSERWGYVGGKEVNLYYGPYHRYGASFNAPLRNGKVKFSLMTADQEKEIKAYTRNNLVPDMNGKYTHIFEIGNDLECGDYILKINATKDGTKYWGNSHDGGNYNRSGSSDNEASYRISVVESRSQEKLTLVMDFDKDTYYSGDTANVSCIALHGTDAVSANLVYTINANSNYSNSYLAVGTTSRPFFVFDIPDNYDGSLYVNVDAKDSEGNTGYTGMVLHVDIAGISLTPSKDQFVAGDNITFHYDLLGKGISSGDFYYQIRPSEYGDIIEKGSLGSSVPGEFTFKIPEVGELDSYHVTVYVSDTIGRCYQTAYTITKERGHLITFTLDKDTYRPIEIAKIQYKITPTGDTKPLDRVITLYYGIVGLKILEYQTTRAEGEITYPIPYEASNGNHLFVVGFDSPPEYGDHNPDTAYSTINIDSNPMEDKYRITFSLDRENFQVGDTVTIHYRIMFLEEIKEFSRPVTLCYGILGLRMDEIQTREIEGDLKYVIPKEITDGNHIFVVSIGEHLEYGGLSSQASYSSLKIDSESAQSVTEKLMERSPFDYTMLFIIVVSLFLGIIAFRRTRSIKDRNKWESDLPEEYCTGRQEKRWGEEEMEEPKIETVEPEPSEDLKEEEKVTIVEEELKEEKDEPTMNADEPPGRVSDGRSPGKKLKRRRAQRPPVRKSRE